MKTDNLINALAADAKHPPASLALVWYALGGGALVLAAIAFFAMLGARGDIASALESWRFLLKFVVTIAIALSAFALARALSRPDEGWRAIAPYLLVAPALLFVGIAVEFVSVPAGAWLTRAVGRNSLVCLTFIPLIGIGPLAVLLLAVRHGAPTRPALAGAATGLLAGAIAATFYAAHCADDSPLFVSIWYSLAIAGLALLGAFAGKMLARW